MAKSMIRRKKAARIEVRRAGMSASPAGEELVRAADGGVDTGAALGARPGAGNDAPAHEDGTETPTHASAPGIGYSAKR